MITLFGMGSPNVHKVLLMLEELGADYEFKRVILAAGEQFSAEFLELNPNGKVPVIVDAHGPDGGSVTVFESGAILCYLAEKDNVLLPAQGADRYQVLQWLMIQLTGIGPMIGQFVHFKRYAPEVYSYALSRYRTEMLRLLTVLDERLAQHDYLGGARYSVADISTYPWTLNRGFLEISESQFPHVSAWSNRIAERPAASRSNERMKELRALDAGDAGRASPEALDRYFGRGKFARD